MDGRHPSIQILTPHVTLRSPEATPFYENDSSELHFFYLQVNEICFEKKCKLWDKKSNIKTRFLAPQWRVEGRSCHCFFKQQSWDGGAHLESHKLEGILVYIVSSRSARTMCWDCLKRKAKLIYNDCVKKKTKTKQIPWFLHVGIRERIRSLFNVILWSDVRWPGDSICSLKQSLSKDSVLIQSVCTRNGETPIFKGLDLQLLCLQSALLLYPLFLQDLFNGYLLKWCVTFLFQVYFS